MDIRTTNKVSDEKHKKNIELIKRYSELIDYLKNK